MVHVVIINGLGGVGKSEFCKQSKEYCQKRWKQVIAYETSTVDFVKRVAEYAGWDGNKDEKGRKLLYDIKEALTNYDGIPNKNVVKHIEEIERMNPSATHIVFVNCRQSYDITSLKELIADTHNDWNVITLLIKNSNISSNEVPELVDEINKTKYNCKIDNNGDINLLYTLVGNFLEDVVDGKYNKKPDYEKLYNDLYKEYSRMLENFNPDFTHIKETDFSKVFDNFPDVCAGCTNNPKNGGSGICLCTLPYMTTTTGKPLEIKFDTATNINSFQDTVKANDNINTIANAIFSTVTDTINKRLNERDKK